jgi:hypothetical protein
MYVSDAGNDKRLDVEAISTPELVGASVLDRTLLFVRDIASCPDKIEADVKATVFVSGLSAGEWTASAGGVTETVTVSESEKFAKFNLAEGRLTLIKK